VARHFDGVDDEITFGAGGAALVARGALTYLAFVRFTSNHRGGLIDASDLGFRKLGCNPFNNGHLFFSVNGSVGWSSWDYSTFLAEYVIVGFTKQAGNGATVTGHLWQGGVWDHEDLGTVDAAVGSTIDTIVMGLFSGDRLHADLAVAALYASALSNATIDAAGLPASMAAWDDLAPAALWDFDQDDAGDPVPDVSGGGADSTAIVGTTITDQPAGFSSSLGTLATLDLVAPSPTMSTAAAAASTATLTLSPTAPTVATTATTERPMTPRPDTGDTARPGPGATDRPFSTLTVRP
jgi:hypothetical protein